MESNEMIKQLSSLAHLDIDAVHAYQQAIDKVDIQNVKDQLTRFKADHERHVQDLGACIRKLGGQPPEFKPDFKGFLIQGFTAVRSVTGTEGALKAMETNENLTNTTYDRALSWEMPDDVKEVIKTNREDERRHLEYIENCIRNRIWETGKKVA